MFFTILYEAYYAWSPAETEAENQLEMWMFIWAVVVGIIIYIKKGSKYY